MTNQQLICFLVTFFVHSKSGNMKYIQLPNYFEVRVGLLYIIRLSK